MDMYYIRWTTLHGGPSDIRLQVGAWPLMCLNDSHIMHLATYIGTTLLQTTRLLDVELNTSALETLSVVYLYLSLPKSFGMLYSYTMHNNTINIIIET
jgi:hypothetical protein